MNFKYKNYLLKATNFTYFNNQIKRTLVWIRRINNYRKVLFDGWSFNWFNKVFMLQIKNSNLWPIAFVNKKLFRFLFLWKKSFGKLSEKKKTKWKEFEAQRYDICIDCICMSLLCSSMLSTILDCCCASSI